MLDDQPPDTVQRLATRLRRSFIDDRIGILVSSAARGADLTALEVAGVLGLRRVIVLPFSVAEFRETSVGGSDTYWGRLYDRIIEEVTDRGDLIIDGQLDATYERANARILSEAQMLSRGGQRPIAFVVWEGQSRDPTDVTSRFRKAAEDEFDVRDVLI